MTPAEIDALIAGSGKTQSLVTDVPPWASMLNMIQGQQQQPAPTPATTKQPSLPLKSLATTTPTILSDQMSDKLMGRINKQGLESRKAQQEGLSGLENYIQQYKNSPVEGGLRSVDLSPIAALVDSWTGSKLAPVAAGIKRPETAEEKKMKILGLEQLAQKQRENITDKDLDLLKLQLNNQIAKETLQYGREKAAAGQTPKNFYEQEKLKGFGRQAVEWTAKERPSIVSNFDSLEKAEQLLTSGARVSGPGTGMIPFKSVFAPDAVITKEAMDKAVTDTLRPTLGAQFTEAEGERIKKLSYNEDLPPAENLRRLQTLKTMMDNKIQALDALHEHLGTYGSDQGFDYGAFGMRKLGGSKERSSASSPSSQEGATKVYEGKTYKVVNGEWTEM
jgi:hypothetical protein